MAIITLQFVGSGGPINWIIKTRTNSGISHVDVVLANEDLLGSQLHEKDGDGVRIREPNYKKFDKIIRVNLQVTDEQYNKFWEFLLQQVGKPYDLMAIIGLTAHRNWRETDSWFCSELVSAALEYAGIFTIRTLINWVDPQTLLLLVCVCSSFLKYEEIL